MNAELQNAWKASRALLGFAAFAVAILALVHQGAAPRIAAAQAKAQLDTLLQILPAGSFDNELLSDVIKVALPPAIAAAPEQRIWRARRQNRPVAVILPVRAPDGYSGDIDLLVGIRHDGSLAGVRVTAHRETPGLGDAIEVQRSDWIRQFDNKSLTAPAPEAWAVRKDGGDFDQLTGATITPRAITRAVKTALEFHASHRDSLYRATLAGDQDE